MKNSILYKFIFLTILYSFSISFNKTTFVLFLYDLGLSKFEANFAFSVFNFSVIIFEPFSAIIGEKFGCRLSFILGSVLKVLSSFVFLYAGDLNTIIIAELLSGLAAAFISGALTAWAVNKLKANNQWGENSYQIFTLVLRFKSIFVILGGLTGAYLGEVNLVLPWLATLVSFALLFIISVFVMNDNNESLANIIDSGSYKKKKSTLDTIFSGYLTAVREKTVFLLIFSSFFSSMALISLQMFRLPIIKDNLEISQISLGYIWIVIEFARILGTFFVNRYYKYFDFPVKGLILLPVFSSVLLILAFYFSHSYLMILFFFMFEFFEPFYNCLKEYLINSKSGDEGRLTVLSLENSFSKVGSIFGLLWIGYLADSFSMSFAWYFSSVIFAFSSLIYLAIYNINLREINLVKAHST